MSQVRLYLQVGGGLQFFLQWQKGSAFSRICGKAYCKQPIMTRTHREEAVEGRDVEESHKIAYHIMWKWKWSKYDRNLTDAYQDTIKTAS